MKATETYINAVDKMLSPYAFKKLNIFYAGTNNFIETYSDQLGTVHTYPIQLDKDGSAIIFSQKGMILKYQYVDNDGSILDEIDNIKILTGKDGDAPAPFNPTPEELEKFRGVKGAQGLSVIGPDGDQGPDGLEGPAFYTSRRLNNNEEFTVPAGISEIFITASAGGGSGANYAPYFYLFSTQSLQQNPNFDRDIKVAYKNKDETTVRFSRNWYHQKEQDVGGFYFFPGSGFAGEACFRKKITFDDTSIPHRVLVYTGNGGNAPATNEMNGKNGTSTRVYVDDVLKIELAGGIGGEQQIPDFTSTYVDPKTFSLKLNKGFRTGLAYFQFNKDYYNRYAQQEYYQNDNSVSEWFDTYYLKKDGSLFSRQDVSIQVFSREHFFTIGQNNLASMYSYNRDLRGETSIFGAHYTQYYNYQGGTYDVVGNDKKNSYDNIGWGCGGSSAWSIRNNNFGSFDFDYGPLKNMFNYQSDGSKFAFVDTEEIREAQIEMLNGFYPSDAEPYEYGIQEFPTSDSFYDNPIDRLRKNIQGKSGYYVFQPGLYRVSGVQRVRAYEDNKAGCVGDKGQDGYCIIEFGNIKEITK